MNITSFYPALLAKNADQVVEKMKRLGFEVIHKTKDLIKDVDNEYTLQDKNGFRFDVVHTDILEEKYVIRINVDNIEEAINVHKEMGFTVDCGPEDARSSKRALLVSPTGLYTYLIEHKK